jgi:hypothetical protein
MAVGFLKTSEKSILARGLPRKEELESVEVIQPKRDTISEAEDQAIKVSPSKALKA